MKNDHSKAFPPKSDQPSHELLGICTSFPADRLYGLCCEKISSNVLEMRHTRYQGMWRKMIFLYSILTIPFFSIGYPEVLIVFHTIKKFMLSSVFQELGFAMLFQCGSFNNLIMRVLYDISCLWRKCT